MKRTHLLVASTLIVALAASGSALAETAAKTTPPATEGKPNGMMMERGPMMDRMEADPMMSKRREIMMQVHEANRETAEQMSAKRKELDAIVNAEKFDKAAYMKKHGEMQALKDKMETARASTMADALSKMSLEERQAMGSSPRHFRKTNRPGMEGKGPMAAPKPAATEKTQPKK